MRQPCIVVTDDDPIFLELMDEVLREEGFGNVHSVERTAAYRTITAERADLVMLDVHRGQSEPGGVLLQQLRRETTTRAIPVIVCSTDPELPEQNPDWFQEQPNYFLLKPFNLSALMSVVRSTLAAA